MTIKDLHPWNVKPEAAMVIQNQLRPLLKLEDDFQSLARVAGVGVSYQRELFRAVVVVLQLPDMTQLEVQVEEGLCSFPYISGLLAFREIPALLNPLRRLSQPPDLLLVEGHGIAHPRRFGMAAHLGLVCNLPTIGCAKEKLLGDFKDLETEKGAHSDLIFEGEKLGCVLRTRSRVNPLFVSPGHMVSHQTANQLVLKCCSQYRLPDPLRQAHSLIQV